MNRTQREPTEVTLIRSGQGVERVSASGVSAPIEVQILLTSEVQGEMTAIRAWFPGGAVSHWHSHPMGQLLVALSGAGRARCEGGPIIALAPGDALWFPPGNRHWHGAADGRDFCYLSIQQVGDGGHVTWMNPVSENELAAD